MATNKARKKGHKFNKNFTPMRDPLKLQIQRIIRSAPRGGLTKAEAAIAIQKETVQELRKLKHEKMAHPNKYTGVQ